MRILSITALALFSFTAFADSKVPYKYAKATGVSGNLSSIGSDTLNNVMTLWSEDFHKSYPSVRIQVEGKGSSTAPSALIAGTAQLGPMSREMKDSEVEEFEKKFGFKPTKIAVAVDTLAVYVNKDNPIKSLTIAQVDGIFSKTRKGGSPDITTWGQLGLTGDWAKKPISLYGRNSASGTYGFFKEEALYKGDFKDSVKEQPGSAAVVNSVGTEANAIGYSGIGYKTSEVKAVPLATKEGAKVVDAKFEYAITGEYPLGRFLYVYIVKKPNEALPKTTLEFLKFVLSQQGQDIVKKDGYGELPADILKKQLALLGEGQS